MTERHVVIVGAGLAGAGCAQALRSGGFAGAITLVGRERHAPYDRPCLSKELLRGDIAQPPALAEPSVLESAGIRLLCGDEVAALDPGAMVVRLRSGAALSASHIVLATGSDARELPLPGLQLPGVHRLRTWDDALSLRQHLRPGARLVIIGGGLIGCEVASTACSLGVEVVLLEGADELLTRTLGSEVGRLTRGWLRELGVDVWLGAGGQAVLGVERVQGVASVGGRHIPADAVLLSVGAAPAMSLAMGAGLACDHGIVVDGCGRTSAPGIYAAGDVARWPLKGGGSRSLESYINSQQQAAAVAKAILADGEAPAQAPSALQIPKGWTRIAGHHLQFAGAPAAHGELVVRHHADAGPAVLFRVAGQRVLGAIAIDAPREFGLAARFLELDAVTSDVLDALGDDTVLLKTLLARAAARVAAWPDVNGGQDRAYPAARMRF